MDFNIESNFINKMIKNNFDILDIDENHNIYLYYLEKNLLYVKIVSKNEGWNNDIKLRIHSIDNKKYEDISVGGSYSSTKEMEFYLDIDLEYNKPLIRKNIPNNVLTNKNMQNINKKEYYDYIKFQYLNNNYTFSDLSVVHEFINNDYQFIKNELEYIINDDIKLVLYVLLYLNKNGGIFMNSNVSNINIDEYNIDDNLYYMTDGGLISLIFTKINFLNEQLLMNDISKKKKLDFQKYLNNFTIKSDKSIINGKLNTKSCNYYTEIIALSKYTFYILSKNNIKYNIEELQGDYYCLTTDNEVERDVLIEISNNENNKKFMFDEQFIKNKFKNNCIFKL